MTGAMPAPVLTGDTAASPRLQPVVETGARAQPEVVLDLSRLVSRVLHATPTGVDRVEMAYARGLRDAMPERLRFAAVHPDGRYGRLHPDAVARFLDETELAWAEIGQARAWPRWRRAAQAMVSLRPGPVPRRPGTTSRVYIQASPHHLESERRVASILRREQARFICLVHDLIPIEYPEYARRGGADTHRRRIRTLERHADAILTNSAATRASLARFMSASGSAPLIRVAHLGMPLDATVAPAPAADPRPYFVCVGTIEPRKNHLLLLNIWRRMAETEGAPVPRLVLIGRRGWENEQVVDMLERCVALRGHVEEHGRLADRDVRSLVAGARALLLPSFAEGYGMPVSEALALGTRVICSDLPALREAGGDTPLYLDPLDGPAWMNAIRAAALPRPANDVPHPAAAGLALPSWAEHMAILLDLIDRISR